MSYFDVIADRLASLTGAATAKEARAALGEFDVRDIQAVRVSEGGGGGSQPVGEVLTGLLTQALPLGHADALAISPDESTAYVLDTNSPAVYVIDLATRTVTDTVTFNAISAGAGIAVTPDGTTVLVACTDDFSGDGQLIVIDVASATVTSTFAAGGNASGPTWVVASLNSAAAYVSLNTSGTVLVMALTDGTVTETITVADGCGGIYLHPDGDTLYVIGSTTVSVVSIAGAAVTDTIALDPAFSAFYAALTPDGAKLYVPNSGTPGETAVIDTATAAITSTLEAATLAEHVAAVGSRCYLTDITAGTVIEIDTATDLVAGAPAPVVAMDASSLPSFLAAIPNGIAVTSSAVYVLDTNLPGLFALVNVPLSALPT